MTDFELERLVAEGTGRERLAPADRAAVDRLRASHDAFLAGADVEPRIARLAAALARRRSAPWIAVVGAAAAAAVVWWLAAWPAPEPLRRPVAAPSLAIEVDTGGDPFPLSPSAVVNQGDTLRFTVDAPSGFVAIVAPPAVLVPPTAFAPGSALATSVDWIGERDVYAVYASTSFDAVAIARGAAQPPWVAVSAVVHLRAIPRPVIYDLPVNAD